MTKEIESSSKVRLKNYDGSIKKKEDDLSLKYIKPLFHVLLH